MNRIVRCLSRPCAALAMAAALAAPGWAADVAEVQSRFESQFRNVPVEGVTLTPYGLYEVQVGDELVYTDAEVTFVLQGALVDVATRTNVTNARMEQLSAVPFEELPLALAFSQQYGDGSRRLAVFEDPNCGYCKQFRNTLRELDDATIYTFMYPMLAPDSAEKVHHVWCADDKAATWDAWMIDGRAPPAVTCDAPMQELVALGQKLRVRGTPTVIFEDGSRVSGAMPLAAVQARLEQAQGN